MQCVSQLSWAFVKQCGAKCLSSQRGIFEKAAYLSHSRHDVAFGSLEQLGLRDVALQGV